MNTRVISYKSLSYHITPSKLNQLLLNCAAEFKHSLARLWRRTRSANLCLKLSRWLWTVYSLTRTILISLNLFFFFFFFFFSQPCEIIELQHPDNNVP